MLTLGIILMVASIVVGIVALTSAALLASPARSAGQRAGRRARALMARRHGPSSGRAAAREREPLPRAERRAAAYAAEEDPPRWLLVLTIISGAGLLLGLLMVMVASIL